MDKPLNIENSESPIELPVQNLKTQVIAALPQAIINGHIEYRKQERVLDIFNRRTAGPWQKSDSTFVSFFDASVTDLNGIVIYAAPQYFVSKNNILFVLERDGINYSLSQLKENRKKSNDFRDKESISISMSLPGFVLEGTMYRESPQQIGKILEMEDPFIAVTNVSIKPFLASTIQTAKFAAVNKSHIIYLSER
jgi:hypothetical protein